MNTSPPAVAIGPHQVAPIHRTVAREQVSQAAGCGGDGGASGSGGVRRLPAVVVGGKLALAVGLKAQEDCGGSCRGERPHRPGHFRQARLGDPSVGKELFLGNFRLDLMVSIPSVIPVASAWSRASFVP